MSDEALRILIAVQERRLYRNKRRRFEIDGEEPPDRRAREDLLQRGLVVSIYGHDGYRITATGTAELKAETRRRVRALRARTKLFEARGLSFSDAYAAAVSPSGRPEGTR